MRRSRGSQVSRLSNFNVAQDSMAHTLLKECPRPHLSDPNSMYPQCVLGAFIPVHRAVHLELSVFGEPRYEQGLRLIHAVMFSSVQN